MAILARRMPASPSQVRDTDVLNWRTTRLPRHRQRLHPCRRKAWSILFPKCIAVDIVWEPLQRERTIFKVRQEYRRELAVGLDQVIDWEATRKEDARAHFVRDACEGGGASASKSETSCSVRLVYTSPPPKQASGGQFER